MIEICMKRVALEDNMTRLFGIIYALAGPTLAGILITAALTMNMINTKSMIYAAAIGFIVALPIAWIVAKQIKDNA
ncbi:hypothetical protein C8J27_102142 [Rhodobacter aestuarii]|uniref:Uncharacterized protein n=3 Tax=Rhodobacter TaxID=1060 RepID=A0A1N7NAQ2_9RHOB|nr:hypothetical protein C8J27_102142 [Rhodobacter aestuarii]SIS95473.1 hypothetical protein SAMN05421580_107142 [Rhodobacter aestuarii]SOB92727.1 hypothetical protein SAMN05877809_101591 [Rhodobacter sp. JA431]